MDIPRGRRVVLVVAASLWVACGSGDSSPSPSAGVADESAAPREVPPDPAPAAAAKPKPAAVSPNEVKLELTGAIEATLEGKAGRCQEMKGAVQGASFQVRSSELGVEPAFDLTFLVTSEAEWTNPAVILNVSGAERASYARNKNAPAATDEVALARDFTSAEFDVELREVMGERKVRAVGSIRCPQ